MEPLPQPAAPRVSIVLPAYNRAGSVRMAVESVLRQTFADFELLVVDDGSTDGTMAELDGIADPRLHRLANPRNMGASAARNTGIRAARSDWVAFQDSDDEWLPSSQTAGLKLVVHLHFLVLAQPCLESALPDPLHRTDPHNGGRSLLGDELLPGASADPHC